MLEIIKNVLQIAVSLLTLGKLLRDLQDARRRKRRKKRKH